MLLLLSALFLYGSEVSADRENTSLITKYPYYASLYLDELVKTHWCGGSIISKRSVLTSAHCLKGRIANEILVRAGSGDLANETGASWYNSERIFIHENYIGDATGWSYDIGLVIPVEDFEMGPTIQMIPLSIVPPPPAMEVELTGYGETYPGGSNLLTNLMVRTLISRDADFCQKETHKLQPLLPKLSRTQFCTWDPNHHPDACIITDGGPVAICNVLVGVVSWGGGCNQKGTPIYFVSVSVFNEWIYRTSKEFL